jgi:hypothetical protein
MAAARMSCQLCQPAAMVGPAILDHIRVLHPDAWAEGLERWPDGAMVVLDPTLQPADFRR